MIIHIEGFNQNNNYIIDTIYVDNNITILNTKYSNYNWYYNNNILDNTYNNWINNGVYELIYKNNLIHIILFNNNKKYISPLINTKITIKELKNILSIKNNIYFNNIRLNDYKNLEDYNINHMDLIKSHELVLTEG